MTLIYHVLKSIAERKVCVFFFLLSYFITQLIVIPKFYALYQKWELKTFHWCSSIQRVYMFQCILFSMTHFLNQCLVNLCNFVKLFINSNLVNPKYFIINDLEIFVRESGLDLMPISGPFILRANFKNCFILA